METFTNGMGWNTSSGPRLEVDPTQLLRGGVTFKERQANMKFGKQYCAINFKHGLRGFPRKGAREEYIYSVVESG